MQVLEAAMQGGYEETIGREIKWGTKVEGLLVDSMRLSVVSGYHLLLS